MTSASLVLVAALLGWGPVWPSPEPPESVAAEPAPAAPTAAPAPAAAQPPAAAPAATAVAGNPAIIAKAPVDVRARPVLVSSPRQTQTHEPRKPLYKQWPFWVIAGGLFAAVVTATIVATRPPPDTYRGNTPPYYVPLP